MKTEGTYTTVPIEAFQDHRLTLIQVRVLAAICSFSGKHKSVVWPKRKSIANRCGYNLNTVTRATTQLVELGWLEKVGHGGRSAPSKYQITVPGLESLVSRLTLSESDTVISPITQSTSDTVSDELTVSGSETDSEPETDSGSDTLTVSGSDRGKEPTNEPTNKNNSSQAARKRFFEFAETHDALTEAHDYENVLKKKKAANSERAWDGKLKTLQDLMAKGQSAKAVIANSADSGWTGLFEVRNDGKTQHRTSETAIQQRERRNRDAIINAPEYVREQAKVERIF